MTNQTETPRIYVACLAAYNAGILHGKWNDLDGDLDDLWNKVNSMLKDSPIEDAEFIQENVEIGKLLLSEYCGDLEHSKNHIGCYTSIADYAQEITEETTQIPK